MSTVSDSDDASELFWPGYVDAVTNLAINLLFVVAVMFIVLLGYALQIAELNKRQPTTTQTVEAKQDKSSDVSEKMTPKEEAQQPDKLTQSLKILLEKTMSPPQTMTLDKALADKATAEKLASERAVALDKAQRELVRLKKQTVTKAQQSDAEHTEDNQPQSEQDRIETVTAQSKHTLTQKASKLRTISGGVVVVFDIDVVELTEAETKDLLTKMAGFAPLQGTSWQIQAIAQRGFSEAVRLAYYRVNAVRNVLMENGIPAKSIEMRVNESNQSGANNARILVRPARR